MQLLKPSDELITNDHRPRWHLVYFALAAFDLLAVSISLGLNHHLSVLYDESVDVNSFWSDRLNDVSELGSMISRANVAANDVFENGLVDRQQALFQKEQSRIQRSIDMLESKLLEVPDSGLLHTETFSESIEKARSSLSTMKHDAVQIFRTYRNDNAHAAGAHMAAFDRSTAKVLASLELIRGTMSDIISEHLHKQASSATLIRKLETVIGICIVLMVIGIAVYGHHLARVMGQLDTERRESLHTLTDFFENASVGLHIVGSDGVIVHANRCELDLLGYLPEEYIGRSITEFHVDKDVIDNILRTLQSGQLLQNYEARLRCKDGSIKHVLINSNVYWKEGRFIHTRCFTRDITARKRAEQELRDSEARIRAILDTAADAIVSIDSDGRVEAFNPAAEELFGYAVDEILGKKVNVLMPPPYAMEHDDYISRYLETGEKKVIGIGREVVGVRKDGTTFPMLLSVSEVRQGTRRTFTGIVRDITAQKLASEKEREALATAKRLAAEAHLANQAKTEFLASMSHELRTPLNAVIGFSEGLLERTDQHPLNSHQKDRLGKVKMSGEHLLSVINNILDIAKIESGRSEINVRTFCLGSLVSEIAILAEGLLKSKPRVSFKMEVENELSFLTSDPDKIKQILINLVGNAVKFTDKGSVTLRVWQEKDRMLLSVTDTGIGIAGDDMVKIFDKFYQVRDASQRSLKGTGLGLALCKVFTELLGGSLAVNSTLIKGSTFILALPISIEKRLDQKSVVSAAQGTVIQLTSDLQSEEIMT